MCKKEKYRLASNCKDILIDNFKKAKNQENFGNGRYARNLFEKAKFEQADRIVQTNSKAINSIVRKDIERAIDVMAVHDMKKVKRIGFGTN